VPAAAEQPQALGRACLATSSEYTRDVHGWWSVEERLCGSTHSRSLQFSVREQYHAEVSASPHGEDTAPLAAHLDTLAHVCGSLVWTEAASIDGLCPSQFLRHEYVARRDYVQLCSEGRELLEAVVCIRLAARSYRVEKARKLIRVLAH
jgi:hypothetical protein